MRHVSATRAEPRDDYERIDSIASARMHLEVQVRRSRPGVSGITDVPNDLAGGDASADGDSVGSVVCVVVASARVAAEPDGRALFENDRQRGNAVDRALLECAMPEDLLAGGQAPEADDGEAL